MTDAQIDPLVGGSGATDSDKQKCPDCEGNGWQPMWAISIVSTLVCRTCRGTGVVATSPKAPK